MTPPDYGDLAKLLGCENDYVAIIDAISALQLERDAFVASTSRLSEVIDDAMPLLYEAEPEPQPIVKRIEAVRHSSPAANVNEITARWQADKLDEMKSRIWQHLRETRGTIGTEAMTFALNMKREADRLRSQGEDFDPWLKQPETGTQRESAK